MSTVERRAFTSRASATLSVPSVSKLSFRPTGHLYGQQAASRATRSSLAAFLLSAEVEATDVPIFEAPLLPARLASYHFITKWSLMMIAIYISDSLRLLEVALSLLRFVFVLSAIVND